jgi:hypothetical protein
VIRSVSPNAFEATDATAGIARGVTVTVAVAPAATGPLAGETVNGELDPRRRAALKLNVPFPEFLIVTVCAAVLLPQLTEPKGSVPGVTATMPLVPVPENAIEEMLAPHTGVPSVSGLVAAAVAAAVGENVADSPGTEAPGASDTGEGPVHVSANCGSLGEPIANDAARFPVFVSVSASGCDVAVTGVSRNATVVGESESVAPCAVRFSATDVLGWFGSSVVIVRVAWSTAPAVAEVGSILTAIDAVALLPGATSPAVAPTIWNAVVGERLSP